MQQKSWFILFRRRVPLGYIFESNLVEVLLRLFPQPPFRNVTLQCLAEVRLLLLLLLRGGAGRGAVAGQGGAAGQSACVQGQEQKQRPTSSAGSAGLELSFS